MTEKELQAIESELERRGYRKWTVALTSGESYGWFKTFGEEGDGFRFWFVGRNRAPDDSTAHKRGVAVKSKAGHIAW